MKGSFCSTISFFARLTGKSGAEAIIPSVLTKGLAPSASCCARIPSRAVYSYFEYTGSVTR